MAVGPLKHPAELTHGTSVRHRPAPKARVRRRPDRVERQPTPRTTDQQPPQPMDGAFTGVTAQPVRQPSRPWSGPVVDAAQLDEASERRVLREGERDCVIASYGPFDPNRAPVLLVHGIDGSAADLAGIADRLRAEGKQVLIAFYRDRGRATHESGQDLAAELTRVRAAHYRPGTRLDIVAHSMGGVVTRAALNELQSPGWMGDASDTTASPRAGFGDVRVRTIDTPWDGYGSEPDIPVLGPILRAITRFFMTLFGWRGAFDMRGNSEMFRHLYDPPLDRVDVRNTAARQTGEQDRVRALPDLDADELDQVHRFIVDGTLPESHRARNMAGALAQDARFAELRRRVRRARGESQEARRAALVRAYERVMPRVTGTHTSVLGDNGLLEDLARELR